MNNSQQNMGSWMKLMCLVGVVIWAVPLAWHYKQKKSNQK